MTVRELLAHGRSLLSSGNRSSSNIENPALDAQLLLAELLRTNREGLVIKANDSVTEHERHLYGKLLERRLSGECAAYILGRREFMGLEFLVNQDVLVPRPDTELLVEKALEIGDALAMGAKKVSVLDLCTGSGAAAVSLKHERTSWDVWASDISKKALELAKKNAERLLPEACFIVFIESDLFENVKFENIKTEGRFDLIVSNPPYVASPEIKDLAPEVKKEPLLALDGGGDGLDLIRRIIKAAPEYLKSGGSLMLEADPRQMQTIEKLFLSGGFISITSLKDLAGRDRVILGNLE